MSLKQDQKLRFRYFRKMHLGTISLLQMNQMYLIFTLWIYHAENSIASFPNITSTGLNEFGYVNIEFVVVLAGFVFACRQLKPNLQRDSFIFQGESRAFTGLQLCGALGL